MKSIIVIAVVGVAGYWYYTNEIQLAPHEKAWQENARVMDKCVKQETTMAATAGLAGAAMEIGDAERYCSRENGLKRKGENWERTSSSY